MVKVNVNQELVLVILIILLYPLVRESSVGIQKDVLINQIVSSFTQRMRRKSSGRRAELKLLKSAVIQKMVKLA